MKALPFIFMLFLFAGPSFANSDGLFNSMLVAIKPAGLYEDCFRLDADEQLSYEYEATGNLDFNIHVHDNSHALIILEKTSAPTASGTFRALKGDYYCIMWMNPGKQEVRLSMEYSSVKAH